MQIKTHTKKSIPAKLPQHTAQALQAHPPAYRGPSSVHLQCQSPGTCPSIVQIPGFLTKPLQVLLYVTGLDRQATACGPRPSSPFTVFIELHFSSFFPASEMIESWKTLPWSYFWLASCQPWCLPAHRQPLTAVRRSFQLPGFLLKCSNTGFLRA